MAEKRKNWVKAAIKPANRGKFREKAEKAGMSTRAFATKHEGDGGTLGKEARLADTLMSMRHKRRAALYDHPRSKKD